MYSFLKLNINIYNCYRKQMDSFLGSTIIKMYGFSKKIWETIWKSKLLLRTIWYSEIKLFGAQPTLYYGTEGVVVFRLVVIPHKRAVSQFDQRDNKLETVHFFPYWENHWIMYMWIKFISPLCISIETRPI